MAQLMNTPAGPLLCSRINAGSTMRGDVLVSDDGQQVVRVADVSISKRPSHVLLHVAGKVTPWSIRLGRNAPVWRAVGARAGGTIC
jgi:hypothetical protein